ncbi:hypothetical protein D3C72_1391990 [compost metagenome]
MTQVVAVQQHRPAAPSMQALLQRLGHGGLARTRQAGQPDHAPAMAVQQFMRLARNGCGALMNMRRLIGRARDHTGRDRDAAAPVDQDKGPLSRVIAEGVDGDRRRQGQPAVGHLIGRQRLARQRQPRGQGPRPQLHLIAVRRIEGLIPHPQQLNIQPIRSGRPIIRRREHVATRHVHLLSQLEGDCVASPRPRHFDVA